MMQPNEAAGVNAMAEALVASGTVSRADAARMLAADMSERDAGASAEAVRTDTASAGAAHGAAARDHAAPEGAPQGDAGHDDGAASGEERAPRRLADAPIDPLFAPPAAPEEYKFEMQPATGMQPDHLRAVQHWCHTARLPQAIAQSLYSEVERGARAGAAPLTAADLRAHSSAGLVELRGAWGERTGAMLDLGRRLVAEVGQTHPDLIDFLDASGAGSNPRVVRQLAEHAARVYGHPEEKGERA